jgi:soluble lytic murein transglycosylase
LADATQMVAQQGEDDRIAYADAEWQAGWLALRFLGQPANALRNFQNMLAVSQTEISQSRAAYWAGRAAEAMNNAPLAQQWYQRGAAMPEYFYGQLAADKINVALTPLNLTPPVIAPELRAAFQDRELVRAVRLLGDMGQVDLQTSFITAIARSAETAQEKAVAADFARALDRLDLGVRIGKIAARRGMLEELAYAAYPRIDLPAVSPAAWWLVHAITRQESEFNRRAVSRSNARGMMQLLPTTAQMVARRSGLPYDYARLTSDPAYNMTLGSTYLQSRIDLFNGNHVLAVAAYNAGAGNVSKWLGRFGDPRDPSIDIVDWIEQIPFQETRNYVHRVLENAVIYRLLEPGRAPRTMTGSLSDLLGRGRGGAPTQSGQAPVATQAAAP